MTVTRSGVQEEPGPGLPDGGPQAPDGANGPPEGGRRPSAGRGRRALRWSATTLAVLILGTAGAGYLYYEHLNGNIEKGERSSGDSERTRPSRTRPGRRR
ncbi:hypothetical protein GCM10023238_16720 [Streptomyces heliomycini]